MGLQATFAVCDLDFDKTYEKLQDANNVSGVSDIANGTFDFWVKIYKSNVRVQISNKGKINLWHSERTYIDNAVEKLKPLLILANGEICEGIAIIKMQKIGATKMANSTAETLHTETSISDKTPKSTLIGRYEKQLNTISKENLSDPLIAYVDLVTFVPALPSHVQKQIDPDIQQVSFAIQMANKKTGLQQTQTQERVKKFLSLIIPVFVNNIIQLLYAKNEMADSPIERIDFDPVTLKLGEKEIDKIVASVMKGRKKKFRPSS